MNRLHSLLMACCAFLVCACSPDLRYLQMRGAGHVDEVCVYVDGLDSYSIGDKERAVLKPEFETWQRDGLDGFGISYVTYVPDVIVSGSFMNSAPNEWWCKDLVESFSINFTSDCVVVNETRRNGSSQYVRKATAADKRLRQFLLDSVAGGKFPKKDVL